MKNFTFLILLSCLFLLLLSSGSASAQGQPLERLCYYESLDGCITIGYQSVTPRPNQPGEPQNPQLDVEIVFRAECGNVQQISITPIQSNPVVVTAANITGENQNVAFVVNANAFGSDNTLRFTIEFTDGSKTMVDIFYDESLNCGAIFPLPVELIDFKGKATESGISLKWETASELNNSHFEVERSADGVKFSSIGRVRGHGTTSTRSVYTLTDKSPQNGVNYYRLKQVDHDRTTSYFKTIAIKWNAGNALQIAVLPNPCRDGDCTLAISNITNTETLIQLRDMAGRLVFSKKIRSNSHLLELPMHELVQLKGLYFLTAETNDQVVHQRVVLE